MNFGILAVRTVISMDSIGRRSPSESVEPISLIVVRLT